MTVVLITGMLQVAAWSVTPTPATVGDSVVVSTQIAVEGGVEARAAPASGASDREPLADPQVTYTEGIVTVRYTFAFFDARRHGVPMPDIELLHPAGRLVHVLGDTAWVSIASVLPAGDSLPAPQPALAPLRREVTRGEPLVFLVVSVLVIWASWALVRRRSKPRPRWRPGTEAEASLPLEAWLGAGEQRAVAAVAAAHLRQVIAGREPTAAQQLSTDECVRALERTRPDWPLSDIVRTLASLDRARFAPVDSGDLVELAETADRLALALARTGASSE